jgi:GAF domain-containing protein
MEHARSQLTTILTLLALAVLKERSLAEDLERLAALAIHHLPTSSGASIALLIDGKPSTVAVTDHIALELDLVQYSNDEGPCITALAGNVIRVAFLPEDDRFPHFAVGAADQRIMSVLSTPIIHQDAAIGTLNVYSRQVNAFGDADHRVAQVVAAEGANAIAKSKLLTSATAVRDQLQAEYDESALTSLAQGVLMAVHECSTEQALHLIRNAADSNHEPMIVVAQRILNTVGSPATTEEHATDTFRDASDTANPE